VSHAIAAALAIAEHYFPSTDGAGDLVVKVEDAHPFVSGHLGEVWPAWDATLSYPEAQRIGALIGRKGRSIAALGPLHHAVRRIFDDPKDDSPVKTLFAPGARDGGRMLEVYPIHGQDPLEVADALLAPLQREEEARVASGGGWTAQSAHGQVQLAFPPEQVVYRPPQVTTADFTGPVPVKPGVLGYLARRVDKRLLPDPEFRRRQVDLLLIGTMGQGGPPPPLVLLHPGLMRHMSAPTGVGKNVFARAQCWQTAREGGVVVLGVSDNTDVFAEASDLRREIAALGITAVVTPFIAPGGRHDFTVNTAAKAPAGVPLTRLAPALIARMSESGYGCAVNAQLDGRDRFEAGGEPCTSLRNLDPEIPGRHLCPFIGSCGKFSLIRAAATAQIIVTTHACLQTGMVKIPILLDGVLVPQMSVMKLLLSLATLVVIDEADAYQSKAFGQSRSLELASASRPDTALRQIRDGVYRAPSRLRLHVRSHLTRAVFLSEQLLDLAASEEVCTETRQARALASGEDPKAMRDVLRDRRRWYQPHYWDRELLENLVGVDPSASATPAERTRLQAMLPRVAVREEDYVAPGALPVNLRPIPGILEKMLSIDEGGRQELDDTKEDLRAIVEREVRALCRARATTAAAGPPAPTVVPAARGAKGKGKPAQAAAVPPEPHVIAAGVLHALMMKAWLSALNHTVFDLADHAGSLSAAGIEGASTVADAVGHRETGNVIPFGPLGEQVSGFRFEGLDDPAAKPRLIMEVLRGDPHIETKRLGDIVSLALAGHRRAVLGLSATGFLPGASRTHLLALPDWSMPDPQRGGLTIYRSTPVVDGQMLKVGSTPYGERDQHVTALARAYAPAFVAHLSRLAAAPATAHRARALIAVNSYRQARLFAQGLYEAALATGRRLRIFVAVADKSDPTLPPVSDAITLITRDRFAQLADLDGEVLIAPLPRTERGLNILAANLRGALESAIAMIVAGVRPVMPIDDPPAMAASINAYGWRNLPAGLRPAAALAALRALGRERQYEILGAPKRFSALPAEIKRELAAGVIGQCIQLAGRGRRGQTHVELHFLDGAFHDPTWGSDLPSLARDLFESYTPGELAMTGRAYGYTAEEFLDYSAPHLIPGLRAGYPAHFGHLPCPFPPALNAANSFASSNTAPNVPTSVP
jgi:hypothetical protein